MDTKKEENDLSDLESLTDDTNEIQKRILKERVKKVTTLSFLVLLAIALGVLGEGLQATIEWEDYRLLEKTITVLGEKMVGVAIGQFSDMSASIGGVVWFYSAGRMLKLDNKQSVTLAGYMTSLLLIAKEIIEDGVTDFPDMLTFLTPIIALIIYEVIFKSELEREKHGN